MSVIQVDERRYWGDASAIIYSIIEHGIELVGEKKNLVEYRALYDDGYRAMGLEKNTVEEVREFRRIVKNYLDNEVFKEFKLDDTANSRIRKNVTELLGMIDESLAERERA